METAKIRVSLSEGIFEIEGSEQFVSQQIENFKDLIFEKMGQVSESPPKMQVNDENSSHASPTLNTNSNGKKSIDSFPHVFDVNSNRIKVICNIPGDSARQKMQNATILYLFAKKLRDNDSSSTLADTRHVCQEHGFLDSANYTKAIKVIKNFVVIDGNNLKLTIPGERKAEELAIQLNH